MRRPLDPDGLTHSAPEPDPAVLAALVALGQAILDTGAPLREGRVMEGYVRGFLIQYPSIAKAETARALLDRCEGFLHFESPLETDVHEYQNTVGDRHE